MKKHNLLFSALLAASSLVFAAGTSTTVLHGSTTGNGTYSAVNQATDIAGVTPVANGGTGNTSGTATTNANMTGDVTSVGNATTLTNAPVIAKVLTGYVSGAGVVASTDTILQAFQKLNGNDGLKANIASPTFTGTVTTADMNTVGAFTATASSALAATKRAWHSSVAAVDLSSSGVLVGFTANANDVALMSNIYYNGTDWIYSATGASTRYRQISGNHRFSYAVSGSAGGTATWVENFVVGTTALIYAVSGTTILNATSTGLAVTGTVSASGGSANKAICWKSGTTLGYCSTIVGADGSCTCN